MELIDHSHSIRMLENGVAVYAAGFYNNFLRAHFSAYKFEGKSYFCEAFTRLLEDHIRRYPELRRADYLACVPMYPRQETVRGYNAIGMIAEQLAVRMDLPLVQLVRKTRPAKEQNKLTRPERAVNLDSVYASAAEASCFRYERLSIGKTGGMKRVHGRLSCAEFSKMSGILLDDLITTGHTLRAVLDQLSAYDLDLNAVVLATAHRRRDPEERREK